MANGIPRNLRKNMTVNLIEEMETKRTKEASGLQKRIIKNISINLMEELEMKKIRKKYMNGIKIPASM